MRAVKVYGQLAKRVGQNVFRVDVASPAEAVRFLCANFPGLDEWLIDSAQDGVGYRVMVGRTKIGNEDFVMSCNDEATISITPVLCGAGGGGGQVALGIGLIAFSILTAGAGAGFLGLGVGATGSAGTAAVGGVVGLGGSLGTAASGFVLGSFASSAIGAIGASLALTGVAQMISPTPTDMSRGAGGDPRRLQSFNFSGIQNTSQQGTPINLVYGRMVVGSTTLSAGVFNTNMI